VECVAFTVSAVTREIPNATPNPAAQAARKRPGTIGVIGLSGIVAPGIRVALVVGTIVTVIAVDVAVPAVAMVAKVVRTFVFVVAVTGRQAFGWWPFGLAAPHHRHDAQRADTQKSEYVTHANLAR
jgi:hypothetical protein